MLWTDDLETGIDVIDEQHTWIVDYIYQLEYAIKQRDRGSVGQVLNELVDYTLSHFAFEESLLVEAGYPMAKPHKAVHDMIVKRVTKYQENHRAGEDVAEQLSGMLSTWLVHHIQRDDMLYVSEVKDSLNNIVRNRDAGGWLSRSFGRFFS
jgi:hemerythrin